jgi:hypothetical protein
VGGEAPVLLERPAVDPHLAVRAIAAIEKDSVPKFHLGKLQKGGRDGGRGGGRDGGRDGGREIAIVTTDYGAEAASVMSYRWNPQ